MTDGRQVCATGAFLALAIGWIVKYTGGQHTVVACLAVSGAVALRIALWRRSNLVSLLLAIVMLGAATASLANMSFADIARGPRTFTSVLALVSGVLFTGLVAEAFSRGRPVPLRWSAAVALALPVSGVVLFLLLYTAQKTMSFLGINFAAGGALGRSWNLVRANLERGIWLPVGLAAAATIKLRR